MQDLHKQSKTVWFFLLCIVWFILSRHSVMFGSLSTLQCRIRRMNKFAGIETDFMSLNVWLASPGNIIVTAEQNAIYHIFIHSKTFGDHLHRVKRLLQRSNWHFPRQRKADPSVWDGNVSKKGKKKEKVEGIKKLFYWNNLRGVIMSEGLRGN